MGAGYLYDAWIANYNGGTVSQVSGGTVVNTITVGSSPVGACVDKNNAVWITNRYGASVSKIVNGAVQKTISIPGSYPYGICVDANNNIWVTDNNSTGHVFKIVNDVLQNTIYLGNPTNVLNIRCDKNNTLWACDSSGNVYQIIDDVVQSTILSVGTYPYGIAVDKNNAVWVASNTAKKVYKIVGGAIQKTLTVSGSPYGVAVDKNNTVWVTAGSLIPIVNDVVQSSITLGGFPKGISVDNDNNVFVTDYTSASLYKVSNGVNQGSITVGNHPDGMTDFTGSQAAMLFGWASTTITANINADTYRSIAAIANVYSNTSRRIGGSVNVSVNMDTARHVNRSESIVGDTSRKINASTLIIADTSRKLGSVSMSINVNTMRRVAAIIQSFQSMTLEIAPKTLSDKLTIVTPETIAKYQEITGSIKNFPFIFKADEISTLNQMSTVHCIYDIDNITYKPIYNVNFTSGAAVCLQDAAGKIGVPINVNIDNFYIISLMTGEPTFREIVSRLLSWTDRFPNRMINLYIRNDVIYVLQRGKESGTATIGKYNNANVTRRPVRIFETQTDTGNGNLYGTLVGMVKNDSASQAAYWKSGIFIEGDSSITYSAGLVTQEVHSTTTTNSDGTVTHSTETTNYEYRNATPPTVRTKMTKLNTAGIIISTVDYTVDGNDNLVCETEKQYTVNSDGTTTTLSKTRITRHYPLGQGEWATVVEENGVTVSNQIGQGAPSAKATVYNIKNESQQNNKPPSVPLPARLLESIGELPITDSNTLLALKNDLIWLDGKTEERVSLDVYDDHIYDFSQQIVWNGNTYYLERNTVTLSPRQYVQRMELVRWFDE